MEKKVECEMLYDTLLNLAEKDKVEIHPNLKPQLQAESTKWRGKGKSQIISP